MEKTLTPQSCCRTTTTGYSSVKNQTLGTDLLALRILGLYTLKQHAQTVFSDSHFYAQGKECLDQEDASVDSTASCQLLILNLNSSVTELTVSHLI
jgi:hypothetical protein